MRYKHYEKCEAPICVEDFNLSYKDEVTWRPGEKVCQKGPFQKFQKKQTDINRWFKKGKFKNKDTAYTAHELETRSI